MRKLVAEDGHWATWDNSMIFSNVVYIGDKDNDMLRYHLIDDDGNNIQEKPIEEYVVEFDFNDTNDQSFEED